MPEYDPLVADEQNELKKRTMRRLIVAVVLVVAAVVVLTVLSQYKPSKSVRTETRPPETAPPPMIAPAPPAPPAAEKPAEPAPPAPATAAAPAVSAPPAPPPPEVPAQPGLVPSAPPKAAARRHEAPARRPAPSEPAPAERPRSLAPAEVPPATPKGYVVQVGVFSEFANARQLQEKLARHGIRSYTETRLHVGPFHSKEEAQRALAKIRSLGINAVLIPQH